MSLPLRTRNWRSNPSRCTLLFVGSDGVCPLADLLRSHAAVRHLTRVVITPGLKIDEILFAGQKCAATDLRRHGCRLPCYAPEFVHYPLRYGVARVGVDKLE